MSLWNKLKNRWQFIYCHNRDYSSTVEFNMDAYWPVYRRYSFSVVCLNAQSWIQSAKFYVIVQGNNLFRGVFFLGEIRKTSFMILTSSSLLIIMNQWSTFVHYSHSHIYLFLHYGISNIIRHILMWRYHWLFHLYYNVQNIRDFIFLTQYDT